MVSFGLGRQQHPSSPQDDAAPKDGESDIDSSTPWMAASEGDLSLMQSALSALNLPITAADENGYTLLHAAASYNHLHVMKFLLKKSQQGDVAEVDVNVKDNDGDTPLHYAGNESAARTLIEVGLADPTVRNAQGKTALEAKQEELYEMMQEDDDDQNDEDAETLKQLVEYLSSLR